MTRSSGAARAPLAGAAAAVTMSTAAKAVVIGTAAAAVAMGAAMMGHATSFATDVQRAPNAAVPPSEVTVAGTF
ncbi:hypothetical protein R4282_14020 [Rhodococcus oxybenzonivorans]|uniref:hypothetical protein n=1 Tax=Rhodococcus TaxID=1827 RepID=UPI00135A1C3A|nr:MULTISPECIES: hypothetical protein [Rhodococcus]MDV7354122.1 hypothetical protein [Rhodococcus oxybenzonivorans]